MKQKRPEVEKERIHLRLPVAMVRDIDRFADSRGISRSAAVATLLPIEIGQQEEGSNGEVQQGTGG